MPCLFLKPGQSNTTRFLIHKDERYMKLSIAF